MIENLCLNDYHSSDRAVKQKGVLVVDSHTTLLSQMEVLSNQLSASKLAQVNVRQVQTLKYDFYGEGCNTLRP